MFTGFMLPSLGAFTIDGTIILSLGALAVMGIIYKYKDNINFTNTDIIITEDENDITNMKYEKNEVKDNNSEKIIDEKVEDNVKNVEKVKILN